MALSSLPGGHGLLSPRPAPPPAGPVQFYTHLHREPIQAGARSDSFVRGRFGALAGAP